MISRIFGLLAIFSLLQFSCTQSIKAQDKISGIVQSFERDLLAPNGGRTFKNSVIQRFDISKYGEFILKWKGIVGDTACLIYHAEDPTQNEQIWHTKIKNFAVKLVEEDGNWVVNATNVMPGDKVKSYNDWLKFQGCKED